MLIRALAIMNLLIVACFLLPKVYASWVPSTVLIITAIALLFDMGKDFEEKHFTNEENKDENN